MLFPSKLRLFHLHLELNKQLNYSRWGLPQLRKVRNHTWLGLNILTLMFSKASLKSKPHVTVINSQHSRLCLPKLHWNQNRTWLGHNSGSISRPGPYAWRWGYDCPMWGWGRRLLCLQGRNSWGRLHPLVVSPSLRYLARWKSEVKTKNFNTWDSPTFRRKIPCCK